MTNQISRQIGFYLGLKYRNKKKINQKVELRWITLSMSLSETFQKQGRA